MMPAVECASAEWRYVPPEAARAVLGDYLENPEKCEGALKRRERLGPGNPMFKMPAPLTLEGAGDVLGSRANTARD